MRARVRTYWPRPTGPPRLILAVGSTSFVLFCAVATLVETHTTQSADRSAELTVHAHLAPGWGSIMSGLSVIGNTGEVLAGAVVLSLFCVWRGWIGAAFVVMASPVLSATLEGALKQAFKRPRPHLWSDASVLHSFSFPSGHAAASAGLAGAVCWVAMRHAKRAPAIGVVAVLFALGVGLSRVYLGVHWPTDVIGGYALAIFSVCAVICVSGQWRAG